MLALFLADKLSILRTSWQNKLSCRTRIHLHVAQPHDGDDYALVRTSEAS